MIKRIATFILCLITVSLASAQQPELGNLTEDEFAALQRASLASVTGTISFLASDELAGRGTPSKEFTIATAYVASRLRAAGAEGLGPDGSFYLESTIETILTPSTITGVTADGSTRQPKTSVLNSLSDPYEFTGKVPLLSNDASVAGSGESPLAIKLSAVGPSVVGALQEQYQEAARAGARALLILVPESSELWQVAQDQQLNPKPDSARRRWRIPMIVMNENDYSADTNYRIALPAEIHGEAVVRNVVGILPGSDPQLKQEAIVFSAHLDHLGTRQSSQPDPIYNGADDDASGVTAVLTLADIYGSLETRPKRSVIFMTFWGEERGLLGSKSLVENSPWPLEKIVANINIEMIGRPEEGAIGKMWMTGWKKSNLGDFMAIGSRRLGVETFEHPTLSDRLYGASDNYSFVRKGVIAHSFSAGSLHSDYHQPSDEWQKLNLPHMTQIIRGLYAGTLPIANGQLTPSSK